MYFLFSILDMYFGGLKFVPLEFKRLLILQSVNKVKSNLTSCFTRVRFAKKGHDEKLIFTLLTDCRINILLNPWGTNFSPRYYALGINDFVASQPSRFSYYNPISTTQNNIHSSLLFYRNIIVIDPCGINY